MSPPVKYSILRSNVFLVSDTLLRAYVPFMLASWVLRVSLPSERCAALIGSLAAISVKVWQTWCFGTCLFESVLTLAPDSSCFCWVA